MVPDVTQTDHGGAVSEPFFQREKRQGTQRQAVRRVRGAGCCRRAGRVYHLSWDGRRSTLRTALGKALQEVRE